jgi:myo-inositol 2-dehydrogenase/D-chiro-inositol 1-dehydrogenase
MGLVHARNLWELHKKRACEVSALLDADEARAGVFRQQTGCQAPLFKTAADLAKSGLCGAALIATPTDQHREHAETLIRAGYRVLLEKPLTGTLEGDEAFAALLDREFPNSLMLGFQRRFDAPLQYAKQLLDSGVIGRAFKIYSALEDSGPPPDGYVSGGILSDMSVHNVDEILWLVGREPRSAMAVGANLYGHKVSTCVEDFDDALMMLWFGEELLAQVQVTRNHVSGYRVETIIFGEEGQIHLGHFDQRFLDITVEAYGRRGRSEPLAKKTFRMEKPAEAGPEFMERFGPAYKAEAAAFIECCGSGKAFSVTHRDGVAAQRAISMALGNVIQMA